MKKEEKNIKKSKFSVIMLFIIIATVFAIGISLAQVFVLSNF